MTDPHAPDSAQQWTDRLVAVLRRRAGRHLATAEIQAGVRPGYLRKAQSASGNVMLRKFLSICEAADIDPGDVFHEVFPKSDLDPDFGLPVPNIPLPKIAKLAQQRADQDPQRPAVDAEWLEWLETLRYDHPRRAIRAAEAAVDAVESEHLTWLLGIWASACRFLGRNAQAFLVNREALRLAREQENRIAEADVLRRIASLVVSVTADYRGAIRINDKAIARYAASGATEKVGHALVNKGIYLVYLEQFGEAESTLHTARGLLASQNHRYLFSLFQTLGWSCKAQGKLEEALEYVSQARPLTETKYQQAKLLWLNAAVLADLGHCIEPRQAYKRALLILLEISPIEAALVACDQVNNLLKSDQILQARECISAMHRLLGPLAKNTVASAAIRDLIRSEQEGKHLTTELLFRITRRIEVSRRAKARRLT